MDHPHPLLAEYVDGSLGPDDRARVDAHLAECPTCREETRLAAQARQVLGALPEAEPPAGLGMAAIRETRRHRGRAVPGWVRWSAGAAAMALAGLVAFSLFTGQRDGDAAAPSVGREAQEEPAAEDADGQAEGAGPAALRAGSAPTFLTSDRDHDARSLQRLARRLRAEARSALGAGFARNAEAFYRGFDLESLSDSATEGLVCVTQAFSPDRSVVPFLVERSFYEGDPAFVSAFLQGPSPTAEYDRLLMIAADRATCSLRTFASQRL